MITEEWADHIMGSQFANFGQELKEKAKNRIIDIVGCTIAGANAPGCAELKDLIEKWGGIEEATVLVHGVKAPAHNAAWINGVMARSFDFGVQTPYINGKPVPAHISETTVPTAVTVAEWRHKTGKELITALILGDDIAARLMAASRHVPGVDWDGVGTINRFAAVVIASKLIGLNYHQISQAFGIIIDQMGGTSQGVQDGVHTFKLNQGLAARDGIITAELAVQGWLGAKDPLMGKMGYFNLFCRGYDADILTKDLGRKFYADEIFKPYPSCRATHPIINCALNLVDDYNIEVENIAEVVLNVTPAEKNGPLMLPFKPGGFAQGAAIFNLRYGVANVLLRKSVKPEHYTEEYIRDPGIIDLTGKMNIVTEIPVEKSLDSAELKVKMKGGREFSRRVEAAKGNPVTNPLTKEEIEDKFRNNVAFSKTISKSKAEKVLKMINRLDEMEDIAELVKLLVGQN